MGKEKKKIIKEDRRTISEIEKENSDILDENAKHQVDIDELFSRVKGIRKIAKKNRAKLTVNKNIVIKRISDSYNEFNVGDKITFEVPKTHSHIGWFWLGAFRVHTKYPYFTITKINEASVRMKYKSPGHNWVTDNISKDRLKKLMIQKTNIISKEAIIREEDIDKLLSI